VSAGNAALLDRATTIICSKAVRSRTAQDHLAAHLPRSELSIFVESIPPPVGVHDRLCHAMHAVGIVA